jgi:hypothetical protein
MARNMAGTPAVHLCGEMLEQHQDGDIAILEQ